MNKILNRIVWLIILMPPAYLAFAWKKLPASVPLHFDFKGNADRFGDKNELLVSVLILSAVSLLVYLLLKNIYRIDPKRYASENKDRLLRIGFAVAVFLTAINCMIIYSGVKGFSGFSVNLILGATGLLFAIIGNYMPNIKPNYFAGIRLPWTLENPDNWKKTHALAGKLWFAGGLIMAFACLLTPSKFAYILFILTTVIITIIPCVYSYLLYKRNKTSTINN